jgi:hypothetical protein
VNLTYVIEKSVSETAQIQTPQEGMQTTVMQ